MREERPDASLFIGLHKLAEQSGDGLVPELYYLVADRRQDAGDAACGTNVVTFPHNPPRRAREAGRDPRGEVLAFRR